MSTQTVDSPSATLIPTRRPGDSPRAQSVCIEIPVTVHGSRSVTPGSEAAQLPRTFLEETRTMIVFPQGAVVRLSESVSEGQILILKNPTTKQEVACRVVSSKTHAKVKGYVEVEFFQPAAGFWGISFPSGSGSPQTEAPANGRGVKEAKLESVLPRPVSAIRPAAATPIAAPKADPIVHSDVHQTVQPAAAAPAPPAAPSPMSTVDLNEAIAAAYAAAALKPPVKTEQVEATPAHVPPTPVVRSSATTSLPANTSAPSGEMSKSDVQSIKQALKSSRQPAISPVPIATADSIGHDETEFASYNASRDARNRPASSTTPAPSRAETRKLSAISESNAHDSAAPRELFSSKESALETSRPSSGRSWVLGVAAGVIVVVASAGAGAYWWSTQHKPQALAASVVIPSDSTAAASSAPIVTPPLQPAAAQPTQPANTSRSAVTNNQPSTRNSPATQKTASQVSSNAAANPASARQEKVVASEPAHRPNIVQSSKIAAPTAHVANGSNVSALSAPDVAGRTPAPNASIGSLLPSMGQPNAVPAPPPAPVKATPPPMPSLLVPARLIKPVTPIYPRMAKLTADAGDVVIDALVDASGKVTGTKVISGPTVFRQSALDAVNAQKYVPAKLDGVATSSHVTVKFHFVSKQ